MPPSLAAGINGNQKSEAMSLLDQLHDLRQRVHRLLWLTGLSWLVVGFVSSLIFVGGVDWLCPLDDRWLRAGLLFVFVTGICVLAWRRLLAPLRRPFSNLELSGHLEQQFPQLRGRLATAVEFLERGVSPAVGSTELQQRLITQTTGDVEQLAFHAALDRRPSTRALLSAAAVCAVALLLASTHPAEASISLQRWLWPLSDPHWPRKVDLQLVRGDLTPVESTSSHPLRSVQGPPLDLFVVNARGLLPQPVTVEFRRRGSATQSEPLRTTTLRSSADQPREAAAIRLPIDEGSIEFRAVGGDDDHMPWRTLEIVPPPKFAWHRVRITPPKYTGEPSTLAPENATQVRALIGSTLNLEGRTNRAVKSATWHAPTGPVPLEQCDIANERSPVSGVSRNAKMAEQNNLETAKLRRLDASAPRREVGTGEGWCVEFSMTQSGSVVYRLSLVDQDGFENSAALRLEFHGIADPPPMVTLEQPATDQLVTPNAVVDVQARAKDDRALKELSLEARVERENEVVPSDEMAKVMSTVVAVTPAPSTKESVLRTPYSVFDTRHSGRDLNDSVRELNVLPGDRLRLRVVATDHCDVGEPRVGRSVTRTLTVVSPETKAAEIADRLDLLLHDLETLADRQSRALGQVADLRVQADTAGELRPQDTDTLKRVELDQRQIDTQLIGRVDSVTSRARGLLAELDSNQLAEELSRRRLSRITQAIDGLGSQTLPALESTLSRAVKSLPKSVADELREVATRQGEVLTTLQSLVRELTQWRDRRELAREVTDLAKTQDELNRDTLELAPSTIGRSVPQLSSQQQADVAKLADRQSRMAERIEQLRQRLANSAEKNKTDADTNKDGEPVTSVPGPERDAAKNERGDEEDAAQTARETVAELDQKGFVAKAREASQDVAANNLGQAGRTQQQLAAELKALAEKLEHTPTSSTSDAVRELQDLEAKLEALRERQRELLDETKQTDAKRESLTPEQLAEQAQSLRERQAATKATAGEVASRMKNSPARAELESVRRARQHMQRAEEQLGEKQLDRAADEQQAALDDLEQSRRELADARKAAQQQQAAELADELAKALKELIEQQQTVIDETERLSTEQQKSGKWTRPLSKAALNLAEAEQSLADGTHDLAESLQEIEAAKLTLDHAANDLSTAAERLRNRQLDDETQSHEQAALRTLKLLADALAPQKASPDDEAQPKNDSSQQQATDHDGMPQEPVPPIAQLKLLRQLENDVLDATKSVDKRKPTSADDDKQRAAEVARLAQEQQDVANATFRLLERFPTPQQVEPEKSEQKPKPEKPPADDSKEPKTENKSPEDDSPNDDETAPREALLDAMRQAHERLTAKETGDKTQSAEQSAVEQLDKLLEIWQRRAARQQAMARTGQAPTPQNQPPDKNSNTASDGEGKRAGREDSQARNSSERHDTGADREGELIKQRQLREAIWGHLPPTLREKMLNLPHDKTLPKYSEHIRRYYEALAEER